MSKKDNLRWQKILWSAVIVLALTMVAYSRYMKSNSIIRFSIYPYFIWPYVVFFSIPIIILRLFRIGIFRDSFVYIFLGTINFCVGAIGTYTATNSDSSLPFTIHAMFYLNLVLSIFIFFDVFRKRDLK